MIGYVTVGSSDLARARAFYDKVLGELGGKHIFTNERMVAWAGNGQMFMACTPYDKNDPQPGNGVMVALAGSSKDHVAKVWQTALDAGGTDEGAPGFRTDNFYGAYFRDPDGNKFAVFTMASTTAAT